MVEEGVCKEVGELRSLFHLRLVVLPSRIPMLECLPEFIVDDARADL